MSARTPVPETWPPGALIPGTVYRIIRPLGKGGMGEVYEVEHGMLGTRRALKILVKHYAQREDLAERLRVEARGLARLKHPNLVEVYDLATAADGRIFFAMELLDGVTLRAVLRNRGRLSVRTSVDLIVQVLAGLHAAHVAGILHRDVKPENIFVCRDGAVKLLDFGVAKAIDAWLPVQKITGAGMTVGTPRYMSPEQAEGAFVDARTDIYATGQVLWEMLAGRPAFDQTDPFELARAKWKRGVLPLGQLPGVEATPALCAAVDKACQARPEKRFPTADAFLCALRIAVGDLQPQPRPTPIPAGDTRAYPAGAWRHLPQKDTQFDSAVRVAADSAVPLPSSAARELTERVDSLRSVIRDAPTKPRRSGPRPTGPSGTELLPVVAANLDAPTLPDPLMTPRPDGADEAPHTRQTGASERLPTGTTKRRAGPMGIPTKSWLAGFAAFTLPLVIALAIGAWRMKRPKGSEAALQSGQVAPTLSAPAASAAASVEPAGSQPLDEPIRDETWDASDSASSASVPLPTSPLPTPSLRALPPATKRPPTTGRPPPSPPTGATKTPSKKMPGSGL